MLKLALKNIKSKPWRTVATIFAISVAVAMIFAMLSFRGTVFEFIGASETAVAGSSDIKISTLSSSDRITQVTDELANLEVDVENGDGTTSKRAVDIGICPSLYLYASLDGEYVQARGFLNDVDELQSIEVIEGEYKSINNGSIDNVVISKNTAKHFGLKVGDKMILTLGSHETTVYVAAIAKIEGYFLDDAPYLVLGNVKGLSRLVFGAETPLFNEIYVTINDDTDVQLVIDAIKAIPTYADMQVGVSHDYKYINEQTTSLTAPVVLAGAAVLVLAVAIVAFVFVMSEKDKVEYIARLRIVGATSGQLFAIFLIESVILAFAGGLLGSALAVGVFALIVRLTLKTVLASISAEYLFAAATIGIVVSIASSVYPIFKSLKGTIRQNQTAVAKPSKAGAAVCGVLLLLSIASLILECCVLSLTKYIAIASLVLWILTVFCASPYVLRVLSKLMEKSSNSSVKTASKMLARERRFARSTAILSVGVAVSVMLFMSYSITTTVFDNYIKNFENVAFVSNIKSNVAVEEFESVEGVESATKLVWQKCEIKGENFEKNINLLGSFDVLDMVNFEFITSKDELKAAIASNDGENKYTTEPLVAVDGAMQKLYGVEIGDTFDLTVNEKVVKVQIAGFLRHNLFNGNYIVMSAEALKGIGVEVDTVLVVSNQDIQKTVGNIKQKYASQNYYVVSALESYKWSRESASAVFDLVGTLAAVVSVLILIVSVFATLVGRAGDERSRTALLNAGMSKNDLLATETFEHGFVGLLSFVIAFAVSALLTISLIHALMLFGLYFEFMYNAWVVAVVGIVMMLAYGVVPVVLNFKKGYKLKRN